MEPFVDELTSDELDDDSTRPPWLLSAVDNDDEDEVSSGVGPNLSIDMA